MQIKYISHILSLVNGFTLLKILLYRVNTCPKSSSSIGFKMKKRLIFNSTYFFLGNGILTLPPFLIL